MQKYFRSLALIQRLDECGAHWFCLWSPEQRYFQFVTGEPVGQESFRQCVTRVVSATLGLRQERDFLVANMAQLNLEFADRLPGDTTPRHVGVAFYVVNPYSKSSWGVIESHPRGRWLSARELLAGRAEDGRPIDPKLSFLLRRADIIHDWE